MRNTVPLALVLWLSPAAGSCNWATVRPSLVANSPGQCKFPKIARIPARVGIWHAGARLIARQTAGKACRVGFTAESAIDPRGVSRMHVEIVLAALVSVVAVL